MPARSTPLITLTTDFGSRDPYAAEMKGVICQINPRAQVIDLSHEIPPQDVLEGALFLAVAVPYFPKGTLHVAVVDPGVGTGRHPIAVSAGGQILLCPDNGLPTMFLRRHPLQEARIITNRKMMRLPISETFHGRDVFAPAAARLAAGVALRDLGEELDTIVLLDVPQPRRDSADCIRGEVMHVDRFGNLITNIHRSLLGDAGPASVRVGRQRLRGVHHAYADVAPGAPLALFGSSDHLEIAVNGGNACAALRIEKGDEVALMLGPATPARKP